MFTANRRIYLDGEGKVVEADNPARATLLIAEGQTMPIADARRYGLVADEASTPAPDQGDDATGTGPKKSTKRAAGPSEDK
jgi:hypothetical protein